MGNSYSQNLDILKADIASGNTELKRNALHQIKVIHTEEASRLAIPLLADPNEIVRATAASAVIYLNETEAAQMLAHLLNDKSAFVRRETAYALGDVGNWSATSRLRALLKTDKDMEVRSAIVIALGNIGDYKAAADLTSLLSRSPKEEDEFLRRSAAHSIGQIAQLIYTGGTRFTTPESFLPSKYKDIGPPKSPIKINKFDNLGDAVPVLKKVLQNKNEADDTRREAAFALGTIRDESSITILRSFLNSPDVYLAEICKEALIRLGANQ